MTLLPLLTRATEDGTTFVLTPTGHAQRAAVPRMPPRAPAEGEQYRFHFDMGKCIGCKCCVVACNEQNGNPASVNWRRVGEIEGGFYPHALRSYLSMGCNHCLEPTCLSGCPVDAYTKDLSTGIVLHSADTCIGCQYCTWNCSYGVPQYNPERGVIGKCDLCHSRVGLGQAPACVSACPSGAIQVEIVKIEDWRAAVTNPAGVAGLPSADHSLSTTRITLPRNLHRDARPVDLLRPTVGDPHWPLIVMTVLTQLSVGAFGAIWLLQLLGVSTRLGAASLTSLLVGCLALGVSTLHLGRPAYAYRALKMWKRSWLSREVLLFTMFSAVACLYAAVLWTNFARGMDMALGALTVALGAGGIAASGCIYRVPSRPAWNTSFTLLQFNVTAATLGPFFVAAIGAGDPRWLAIVAASMAVLSVAVAALRYLRLIACDGVELRETGQLLATRFLPHLLTRGVSLAAGAIVMSLFTSHPLALWVAFSLALGSEILDRYLFFVSAVPKHLAAPYVGSEAA